MSWFKQLTTSSLGKKLIMALSGIFLMVFLLQHFLINFLSIISADTFNSVSHFMGTNPLVQFLLQPILIAGVVIHFIMGIYLELKNRGARNVKYAMYKGGANSSWMSRNMIYSGLVTLAFLGLHFYDFWIPEITTKYIEGDMSGLLHNSDQFRYYEELVHKFHDPVRVGIYVVSFILLALHLLHGFQSSFQSAGFNSNKYTPAIQKLGNVYAIVIPLGFAFIALYHYLSNI